MEVAMESVSSMEDYQQRRFKKSTKDQQTVESDDSISEIVNESKRFQYAWLAIMFIYIGVCGFGAALVSFMLEASVFVKITQNEVFSVLTVFILESAKVGTIVVFGFIKAGVGEILMVT